MADEDRTDPPTATGGPDEFPEGEELPDEPPVVEDSGLFEEDPAEFDDINAFAGAEWEATTTARARVRAVIKRTETPTSASDIADVASVSETTARNTLKALDDEGVVRAEETANGKRYRRDPDWHLMRRVQRLARSDRLVSQIEDVRSELNGYREAYGVDSPDELVVSDGVLSDVELEDVGAWRTAERDLSFLRAAYRFREAKRTTTGEFQPGDDDTRVTTQ
jgi:DNA-binding transcriptional ArsR family regulator